MKLPLVNGKQASPKAGEFSVESLQHVYDAFTATILAQKPLQDGRRSIHLVLVLLTAKRFMYWTVAYPPSTGLHRHLTEMPFSDISKPIRTSFLP